MILQGPTARQSRRPWQELHAANLNLNMLEGRNLAKAPVPEARQVYWLSKMSGPHMTSPGV